MSEPNKNKQRVVRDRNEQQSAGFKQPNSRQRAIAPSLDVEQSGYTRIVPPQFEGQLSPPYSSSIGSNTNSILNNPLVAQQIEGRHGFESSLSRPNLPSLQPYSQPVSDSAVSLDEQRIASRNTKHPPQRANPGTSKRPVEHSSPCQALPCAKTVASASQAETLVEDSSQLSHSTSELVKPKRPLSAYNIFFQEERAKIIEKRDDGGGKDSPRTSPTTHKKQRYQRNGTGFEDLAKEISKRWKNIEKERLAECTRLADADTERYQKELAEFNGLREARLAALHQAQMASVSEEVWKRYLAEAESQKPPRKRNREKKK